MNALELLETYPKTAIVVKQWYLEKMLDSLQNKDIPEDFKEAVRAKGIDNENIAMLINASPRNLFDVFDSHKIYVETLREITGFWWKIKDDKTFLRLGNDPYNIRKESDAEAIIEAFKLLEEKL